MNGDIKIGKLLCDEDIITKRQLNQALQVQIKGDKRALGEILVDKGFCTLDDITEVLMDEPQHEVKKENLAVEVFSNVVGNPTGSNVEEGVEFYKKNICTSLSKRNW